MAKEKSFNIEGTIYAKNTRVVQGKKDPTKTYEFKSIVLEVTSGKEFEREGKMQYVTKTTLLEIDIAPWIDVEPYAVGDFIDIRFIIEGNEFTRADKTKAFINKLKATYIKYADLDSESRPNNKGKVTVTATSDVNELSARETVFVSPDPEGEDNNDLPFILAIPIALGFLTQFMI